VRTVVRLFVVSCCTLAPALLFAQGDAGSVRQGTGVTQDLKRLSLEELAQLDVTTVSRRVERLSEVPAAISIVRQDDIRRAGVTSLPEAMRLADGLDVARTGTGWSISARGFNIGTANKLLVLMDGRTLYSPLYAGTFWDIQDTLLADIDRIEVIRGPGGTMWGANAVNGVINIITRDASQTRGNTAQLTVGSENQLVAAARHGGRVADGGSYRVYGRFRRFGPQVFADGTPADNALTLGQLGVRLDSAPERQTTWSLQGSAYGGGSGQFAADDTDVRGGFVRAAWSRRLAEAGIFTLRTYYDHTYRRIPLQFEEGRHTAVVDVQHNLVMGRHNLVFGGEYRASTARTLGSPTLSFDPERRTNQVGGVFVQTEITLRPDLYATIGSKAEANDYTGMEVQPTARLRWTGRERQTVWGAVSRAVRLPTRLDTDLWLFNPAAGVEIVGSDDFESESVVAYEAGYRLRPSDWLSVDVAAFTNRYDNIRSQEQHGTPVLTLPGGLLVGVPRIVLGNTLRAATSGFEGAAHVQLHEAWRVRGSLTTLRKRFSAEPGSQDVSGGVPEGNDPPYFFTLRSYTDLPHGLALDGLFRRVGRRPAPLVPSYSSLDLRFAWAVRPGWEVSLVGQNLLQPSHPEFGAPSPRRIEIQRGVHVRSSWHF
jgi:iron complex outermembrane recepter protein